MAAPKKVDYDRIEPDWRAGLKSPPQLASEYTAATGVQVSHTAIIKHFKKLGIARDLSAKVQAKAESMVLQATVSGKVSAETIATDSRIVEDNATIVANVLLAHRTDATRFRRVVLSLLTEVEAQTEGAGSLEELRELVAGGPDDEDDAGRARAKKLQEAFDRVVSLPGRTKVMKDLASALATLIALEREAYGVGKVVPPNPDDSVDPLEGARRLAFILSRGANEIDKAGGA